MGELLNEVVDDIESIDADFTEYLTFKTGNEIYGAKVENVREVIEYDKVFPVPKVPDHISGVINLRGSVVPVVDLSFLFYKKKSVVTKLSCIVIVDVLTDEGDILVGVVIDAIKSVVNLKEEDIENAPSFGAKINHEYISGVSKVDESFLILLNLGRILKIEDLA